MFIGARMPEKIALIGECMLELTQQNIECSPDSLPMRMSYGGDTLNSAIYLARQGVSVDYVTALGDDPMSAWMIERWQAEGVNCELVQFHPGAVPGLYLVDTDSEGERSFYYWRDSSPARRLLDDPLSSNRLFSKLAKHNWVFLSGISLAIYENTQRETLFELINQYRRGGGKVIFDSNYRPKLWKDRAETLDAYKRMYELTDIALPTLEDEQQVFGETDVEVIIARLKASGVSEIVLKMGEGGCLVVSDDLWEKVPCLKVSVVDTTSAGDSFNAGYLAARSKGQSIVDAAKNGHKLASVVIQHKGAIISKLNMPVLR